MAIHLNYSGLYQILGDNYKDQGKEHEVWDNSGDTVNLGTIYEIQELSMEIRTSSCLTVDLKTQLQKIKYFFRQEKPNFIMGLTLKATGIPDIFKNKYNGNG